MKKSRQPPNRIPSCFISYCHKNADRAAIQQFENSLEYEAKGTINIIRDKKSLVAGDNIKTFEDNAIWQCDVAILLLTPEYLLKIQSREGGAHREFTEIVNRYRGYVESRKTGNISDVFHIIPIIFSGNFESSLHTQIVDLLALDFTGFRVVRDEDGKDYIPKNIKKDHRPLFQEITEIIHVKSVERSTAFKKYHEDLLDGFFLETKHELIFKQFKDKGADELFKQAFVETQTFLNVKKQGKIILVGRKGSGKSTITDNIHLIEEGLYKTRVHIDINEYNFTQIWNSIFQSPIYEDIEEYVSFQVYFEVIWRSFFYIQAARVISYDYHNGDNIVDFNEEEINTISKFITSIIQSKNNNQSNITKTWPSFIWIFYKSIDVLNNTLYQNTDKSNPDYFATIADELMEQNFMEAILPDDFLAALQSCIEKCKRRFLFSLDGFDSKFDKFRLDTQNGHFPKKIIYQRNRLEIDWLRGGLHSAIQLKSSDEITNNKIDFCLTVPKDRFMEIKRTERDAYIYREKTANIDWLPNELQQLAAKRLVLRSGETTIDPVTSLHKNYFHNILKEKYPLIPQKVDISLKGNINTIDTFSYLLRHTFWRPRDILFLIARILSTTEYVSEEIQNTTATIKEAVSSATFEIIEQEFLNEFRPLCDNLATVIECFEKKSNILSFENIKTYIDNIKFETVDEVETIEEKINFLYEIGFLGIVDNENLKIKKKYRPNEFFSFSDGEEIFFRIPKDDVNSLKFAIHPLFNEYLALEIDKVVCIYDHEYLSSKM